MGTLLRVVGLFSYLIQILFSFVDFDSTLTEPVFEDSQVILENKECCDGIFFRGKDCVSSAKLKVAVFGCVNSVQGVKHWSEDAALRDTCWNRI